MHANNEVGTTQPVEDCAAIARAHGVLSHTDAAQSGGKIPARVDELGVDLLTIAGHKLYAPKGVGALYIRNAAALEPLIHGTDHERGRRASTASALLDAALGEAGSLARSVPEMGRVKELRDHFWTGRQEHFVKDAVLNGHPEGRLPNTLNVSVTGRVGANILRMLEDVAASMGRLATREKLSPRRYWRRWACRPRSVWVRSDSVSAVKRAKKKSTPLLKNSRELFRRMDEAER